MSTKVTVELLMLKAEPFACLRRRPQSKTVATGAPLMTSDGASLMRTVVSLKTPELRYTCETPTSLTAYEMVRQIKVVLQFASLPLTGSTRTDTLGAAAAGGRADKRQTRPIIGVQATSA
jgi:hypothetical protein